MNFTEWRLGGRTIDVQTSTGIADCHVSNPLDGHALWRDEPQGCEHRHFAALQEPFFGKSSTRHVCANTSTVNLLIVSMKMSYVHKEHIGIECMWAVYSLSPAWMSCSLGAEDFIAYLHTRPTRWNPGKELMACAGMWLATARQLRTFVVSPLWDRDSAIRWHFPTTWSRKHLQHRDDLDMYGSPGEHCAYCT